MQHLGTWTRIIKKRAQDFTQSLIELKGGIYVCIAGKSGKKNGTEKREEEKNLGFNSMKLFHDAGVLHLMS